MCFGTIYCRWVDSEEAHLVDTASTTSPTRQSENPVATSSVAIGLSGIVSSYSEHRKVDKLFKLRRWATVMVGIFRIYFPNVFVRTIPHSAALALIYSPTITAMLVFPSSSARESIIRR